VGDAKPRWMPPRRGTGTAISKIKVYFLHHAAGGILQLILPEKTCYLIAFAATGSDSKWVGISGPARYIQSYYCFFPWMGSVCQ